MLVVGIAHLSPPMLAGDRCSEYPRVMMSVQPSSGQPAMGHSRRAFPLADVPRLTEPGEDLAHERAPGFGSWKTHCAHASVVAGSRLVIGANSGVPEHRVHLRNRGSQQHIQVLRANEQGKFSEGVNHPILSDQHTPSPPSPLSPPPSLSITLQGKCTAA